jgi:hypothetical protein
MDFDEFLRKIGKKYRVERRSDTRYSIFGDKGTLEVDSSNIYDYDEVDGILSGENNFGKVGRDDLYPRLDGPLKRLQEEPRGAFVSPRSDIFRPRKDGKERGNEEDNPFIRVDPIAPRKGDKKGFEPDPGHLKRDEPGPDFKP